jgi:hypothetical protein
MIAISPATSISPQAVEISPAILTAYDWALISISELIFWCAIVKVVEEFNES